MKSAKSRFAVGLAFACAVLALITVRAEAQAYTTLAFFNGTNGDGPDAPFVQGTDGNFYSTTYSGGAGENGNVYKMTPAGEITNLYSFCLTDCLDGLSPSGIILGSDTNFYGTTYFGGENANGTIFTMTVGGKLTTLYSFCSASNCEDGKNPNGIIQASSGEFYGTALYGGTGDRGAIFELTTSGILKTLYSFCSQTNCADGWYPTVPPIEGNDGNLYGTTMYGGKSNGGVVYQISPAGSYKVLRSLCSETSCDSGQYPGGLVQDSSGDLYGPAQWGADGTGYGTVFKITPEGQFTVVHRFHNSDGDVPAGVILANDGNLYGTTYVGGIGGLGTIFQMTPSGALTTLYNFCAGAHCPGWPNVPFQGTNGLFYSTTSDGGRSGYGATFSLSNNLSPLVETVPVMGKVGTQVIILGNNLTGASTVTFNGVSATFTVESDTYITATVPAGATTGTVSVVTSSGTLNSSPGFVVTK